MLKFEKFGEVRKSECIMYVQFFEFEEIVWRKFWTSLAVFVITNSKT